MPSFWFSHALTTLGWERDVRIDVACGLIRSVERGVSPGPDDLRLGTAVPGLPNLHSHAFQRAMAGFAERRGTGADSFWTWREAMYGFALRMGPDHVEAVAAQLYVEMLEAGFTRVGEFHYLHHDEDGRPYAEPAEMACRVAAAAEAAGIGLTLLPVFYAHAGFGGAAPSPGQRRFVSDLDGFARLREGSRAALAGSPGAILGLAAHSLRAVTPGELHALVELAEDGPVHIHVAEQVREVDECLAWSGRRPVAWLLDAEPVGPSWCLIHATHMDADETARLAATGAVAGLCPITEANLGDGTFPGAAFHAAGGRWGIGSDSHVQVDVAAELRQLEYSQRIAGRARNVLAEPGGSTGRFLVEGALRGGAAALGAGAAGLVAGASADFLTLRTDHPAAIAHAGDALLDAWVFTAGRDLVDGVWTRGVQRVGGGIHHDRARIRQRFAAAMRALV